MATAITRQVASQLPGALRAYGADFRGRLQSPDRTHSLYRRLAKGPLHLRKWWVFSVAGPVGHVPRPLRQSRYRVSLKLCGQGRFLSGHDLPIRQAKAEVHEQASRLAPVPGLPLIVPPPLGSSKPLTRRAAKLMCFLNSCCLLQIQDAGLLLRNTPAFNAGNSVYLRKFGRLFSPFSRKDALNVKKQPDNVDYQILAAC